MIELGRQQTWISRLRISRRCRVSARRRSGGKPNKSKERVESRTERKADRLVGPDIGSCIKVARIPSVMAAIGALMAHSLSAHATVYDRWSRRRSSLELQKRELFRMKPLKSALFKILLSVAGAFGTSIASANTTFGPLSVLQAGTYGDGSIFIILSGNINAGCSIPNRIDVPATNPQVKQILAIALQAVATGQLVVGAVNGCSSNTATIDTSINSYIWVQQ